MNSIMVTKPKKNHSIFLYRSRIGHGLYSFMYAACVGSYTTHYVFIIN